MTPINYPYGLGHVEAEPVATDYAMSDYIAVDVLPAVFTGADAPIRDQGKTPFCEAFTGATGRDLTERPDASAEPGALLNFDALDLANQAHIGANGTTTAVLENALLHIGARATAGPLAGRRFPTNYAACRTIDDIRAAVFARQFAGLAVSWDESWFSPNSFGTLPAPSGKIAGGHIFRVKGWSMTRGAHGQLLCQNSWGPRWSNVGLFWMPIEYLPTQLEAYTQIDILDCQQTITPFAKPRKWRVGKGETITGYDPKRGAVKPVKWNRASSGTAVASVVISYPGVTPGTIPAGTYLMVPAGPSAYAGLLIPNRPLDK